MRTDRLVKDFIVPWWQGGEDTPENTQYLTEKEHWEKTKKEWREWEQT